MDRVLSTYFCSIKVMLLLLELQGCMWDPWPNARDGTGIHRVLKSKLHQEPAIYTRCVCIGS